jgi:hypothetical protein
MKWVDSYESEKEKQSGVMTIGCVPISKIFFKNHFRVVLYIVW